MLDLATMLILPPEDPNEDSWEAAGQTFCLFLTKACQEIAGDVVIDELSDIDGACLAEAHGFTKALIENCLESSDMDEQSTVWGVSPEPISDTFMTSEPDSTFVRVNELRAKAAQTLLSASLDGRLAGCLASAQEQVQEDVRMKAQQVLVSALESGRLESTLLDVSKEKRKEQENAVRHKAQQVLVSSLDSGALQNAIKETMFDKTRQKAAQVLQESALDGRLQAALMDIKDAHGVDAAEATRMALTGALADGRLQQLLAGVDQNELLAKTGGNVSEDVRKALLMGAKSGELDAALAEIRHGRSQLALVPRPPVDSKPLRKWERPPMRAAQWPPVEKNFKSLLQMISDTDRKAGALHIELQETTRLIEERDKTCKQLKTQIEAAAAEVDHLRIDCQWHQEQIALAETRGDKLRENRIALALELEDIRQGKELEYGQRENGKLMKNSSSERSLASTCAGSGADQSSTYSMASSRFPAITEAGVPDLLG